MLQQDAFSLLEMDDAVDCLSYFIHILAELVGGDGKESAYYALFCQYISETLRFMEQFQGHYEKYQGAAEGDTTLEPFNYDRFGNMMADLVAIFKKVTVLGLRDKNYFLMEQKFWEILVGFLESDSRLFSGLNWRRLMPLNGSLDLLQLMLDREGDATELNVNVNVLRAVLSSVEHHILHGDDGERVQRAIVRDTASSRDFVHKMYDLMATFTVFEQKHSDLLAEEDDDGVSPVLISDEMRQFFVDLVTEDWDQQCHVLAQSARKKVLRTLLILRGNGQNIDELVTDRNRFVFHKGVERAILTQCIDDKTESGGLLLGQRIRSDAFQRLLAENARFVSSAFALSNDNVFQTAKLNEWRLGRLEGDKMVNAEQWGDEGMVKGPLFEWRSGAVREGAGLHPTLNDVDLEGLEEEEIADVFNVEGCLDEDSAMLTKG